MSMVPGAAGQKSVFPDGVQVDHISENTLGHGVRVRGISDPTTYPVQAGDIGEYKESGSTYTEVTGVGNFTNGQYKTIATVTLSKGVWLLRGAVLFGGGTSQQSGVFLSGAISAYSDNTQTDRKDLVNVISDVSTGVAIDRNIQVNGYYVTVTADNTPYYMKGYATNWSATPTIRAHISAVRIA